MKDIIQQTLFSPMSERSMCTSDKYSDCLNCALGSSLGCVHLVRCANLSEPFRYKSNSEEFDFGA